MNLDTFIRNVVNEIKKINGGEEVILKGGYKLVNDEINGWPTTSIVGTKLTLTSETEDVNININVEILYK